MIRRIERSDGTRYEVYGRAATCAGPCEHAECRVDEKGRRASTRKVYVGVFTSKREAEAADRKHAVTQEMIADGELAPETDTKRTFTEAADEWIASLRKSKARKADGYSKRLEIYLKPTLGNIAISRISASHVMSLRDEQAERLAPATVNGNLITLSSAFTYFKKRQWIATNPVHGVERVENPQREYQWIHTREEITRLLLACNDELRDMVAVALGTGLRFDELLHLQWADMDLARRLLSIHRGRNQGTVKSGRLRRVPILDSVLGVLKARALKRGGSVLVFPGRDGRVRTKQGVYDIFKLALKRAQIDERIRWHDLRHTFASHWMMDGGCVFKLAKVLGHSSVAITEKIYAHLAPQAFEADYGRVAFVVPSEPAKIYELHRDVGGKIIGRDRAVIAAVG